MRGKVALDDPRVRHALREYRLRSARSIGIGCAAVIAAGVIIGTAPSENPSGVAGTLAIAGIALGGVAAGFGVGGLLRSIRMKWHLKREAWTTRRASYRIAPMGANGQPALLVKAEDHHDEAVCAVPATVWRYRRLTQGPDISLLVVGNPRRWAVIAPPDVGVLLCAKRPWVPFWGKALRRYATNW